MNDDQFIRLLTQHCSRIWSLCLRMTGQVSEAERLMQQVLRDLHRKACLFHNEPAFLTWLHRVIVNQVLKSFRSSAGYARVIKAIAQLPPGYRAVFVLHEEEGYTHPEIAGILGCQPGTSRSQLCRAWKKLAAALDYTAQDS